MLRFLVHYGLHFLLPIAIALLFYKKNWLRATLILLAGIIIDIDHLWATPIYDADRCSIGFHFLHSQWAIALYFVLFIWKKTRLLGLALLIHILADAVDCLLM